MGAAPLTHRRLYSFWKASQYPLDREGAGQALYKNNQNICYTSNRRKPGERFVKAPLVQYTAY